MSNDVNSQADGNLPMPYEIRIQGHLGCEWAAWFGNATITPEGAGLTLLAWPALDQPALYGMLKKVRDLGMPLISVIRAEPATDLHAPAEIS